MTPVFGHGRLRLYLLKLLDESPRHGYEIIQQLRERFAGLYSPSAGTVYPRLARLETEGLIRHETDGGRKVYQITDAGRAELAARADELEELETEIRASARDLAEGIRQEVRESAKAVQQELADQARRAQQEERGEDARSGGPWGGWAGIPPWAPQPPGSADWNREQWREWKQQLKDQAQDWKHHQEEWKQQQKEWREQQKDQRREWRQQQRDWQRDWKEQWARQWKEQWQQQQRDWEAGGGAQSWRGWIGGLAGDTDFSQLGDLLGYLRREGGPVADAFRRHGTLSAEEQAEVKAIIDSTLQQLKDLLDGGPRDARPEPEPEPEPEE
ncbi:helix-turn-helix transcriptional regulator [Actinospica sp. MGRD01-02]|uniref:Helix-turn-helix transcriptional regulator n=1 Tax=Actinospica acidithermotolerans TaxID=2828514 RepID=A0A941IKB1_9ACTN|nr:PadR family transcriptional regulator [Actinospica acidithermotolerans]MBR7828747.1 helix-turn-helix transcriptional regulator [Actinospica acidithermotolerans]